MPTCLPGSTIDVSGGVEVGPTGKRSGGNAGSITIASGQDLNISSVLGGTLLLGAQLKGYAAGGGSNSVGPYSGGGNGGSLSIQTSAIQIGGAPGATTGALYLTPQFFDQGRLCQLYAHRSWAEPGQTANSSRPSRSPRAPSSLRSPKREMASTSGGGITFMPVAEPLGIRTPVNLTFNAPGISDKYTNTIELDAWRLRPGSRRGDSHRSLEHGDDQRRIPRPSSVRSWRRADPSALPPDQHRPRDPQFQKNPAPFAVPNLDLGPHSLLSTAGTVVLVPNERGYLSGTVLAGGTISLSGNIVAEAGSVMNVSGTTGILDLAPAFGNESAPLIGALSGQVVTIPQTRMSAAFPRWPGRCSRCRICRPPPRRHDLPESGSFCRHPGGPQ